jgi:TolB protein
MRRLAWVVFISSIVVSLYGCKPTAHTNGQIALSGFSNGQADIYIINLDGNERKRVTSLTGSELYPAWSPDGSQIAFAYNDNGVWSLYTVNADGTDLKQLFHKGTLVETPVWSPDGKQIAFASDRHICTISSSGQAYSCFQNDHLHSISPAWSPDGKYIAFTSLDEGPQDVRVAYVMDVEGASLRPLTARETSNSFVSWSPDGANLLLFQSRTRSNAPWGLYIMRPDGSDKQFIFERGVGGASWSPDGQWLVLSAPTDETEKYSAIYIIKSDGTDLTSIPTGFDYATAPAWRPNQ